MLEANRQTAEKYGIDFSQIENKVDLKKNLEILGNDLTFLEFREYERTKHVHRFHPYLGKFIPQLVEVFLRKYFKSEDWVLDPFSGSGTTLIEANVLGINSVGIELSGFNVLIQRVKTQKYDLEKAEKEILDALSRLKKFSQKFQKLSQLSFFESYNQNQKLIKTASSYLKEWFSPRALEELLFYRSIIPEYQYQTLLMVILSRSARSARLIPHYDLARPKKPIKETYWCIKHKRYCQPIDEAFKFIERYSYDTIKRLKEFVKIRTSAKMIIFEGDAQAIKLPSKYKFQGVFTSPPYVGLIDYHEQHRYAYELFDLPRKDQLEIGPSFRGNSNLAKGLYKQGIISTFKNLDAHLIPKAKIFVVANDKYNLYPEIGKALGFKIMDVFHRPVLMRTERDTNRFFESIFYFQKE